jgi:ribosomal protein S12 methylthiotransferase accessory factor YcaO
MHKHLLDIVGGLDEGTVGQILELAGDRDPLMVALICEASLSFDGLAALQTRFDRGRATALLPYTPLITIKSSLRDDQKLHNQWTHILAANLSEHQPLPPPESTGLPLLYSGEQLMAARQEGTHIKEIRHRIEERTDIRRTDTSDATDKGKVRGEDGSEVRDIFAESVRRAAVSAGETARWALENLREIDVFAGDETPHTSSLSPHGYLRKWRLAVSVRNGRHDYSVTGIQTSYGKGLTPEAARASYAMEMVERVSSFAGFGPEGVLGTAREYPLVHATFSQLAQSGRTALDPNRLRLEAPYGDEPLYWLEAAERSDSGLGPKLIPAQSVFLFCNLDEISLFSGLGSTGLASGNTMEQAKLSALLEVIERDCEATTLYEPSRCFRVEAEDPLIRSLLSDYAANGVRIQFQDLTSAMGAPCYKCFVVDARGGIVKGTGAHLDARRALVSAMTEVPYTFPGSPPCGVGPDGLRTVRFEDLPSYTTGDPSRDLEILETLLIANGYRPLYVDLTRKDLKIPVVKAIIPGMELMADFDRFSRVSPVLYANYLKSVGRP